MTWIEISLEVASPFIQQNPENRFFASGSGSDQTDGANWPIFSRFSFLCLILSQYFRDQNAAVIFDEEMLNIKVNIFYLI